MKISIVQPCIVWENKERNIDKAVDVIEKHKDSTILLFPEMSFTGFSMHTDLTAECDGYTVERIKRIAKEYRVHIGFGWVRTGNIDHKCENVYTIIDPTGGIVSEYTKIHPFSYSGENERFTGGSELKRYYLNGIPFSTFICYDLRFPEVFRLVADYAHVVIVPACWPERRSEHWKSLLKARAIENQVYVIGINCQGEIGGLYYSGDSCVINPNGVILDILSDKEGVIDYELVDDVEDYRREFPVLRDRRSKLYNVLSLNNNIGFSMKD